MCKLGTSTPKEGLREMVKRRATLLSPRAPVILRFILLMMGLSFSCKSSKVSIFSEAYASRSPDLRLSICRS